MQTHQIYYNTLSEYTRTGTADQTAVPVNCLMYTIRSGRIWYELCLQNFSHIIFGIEFHDKAVGNLGGEFGGVLGIGGEHAVVSGNVDPGADLLNRDGGFVVVHVAKLTVDADDGDVRLVGGDLEELLIVQILLLRE